MLLVPDKFATNAKNANLKGPDHLTPAAREKTTSRPPLKTFTIPVLGASLAPPLYLPFGRGRTYGNALIGGHRLGKVTRRVRVDPLGEGQLVRDKLQREDRDKCRQCSLVWRKGARERGE